MCGFLATFSRQYFIDKDIHEHALSSIIHRGPDMTETLEGKNYWLGFNRLAIIDLNSRSGQPFYKSNQKYILLFNGEIYNYKELKNYLNTKYNLSFNTESDTEVLYHLLIKEGIEAFKLLRGMFSIIFFDKDQETFLCCRDEFGIKPLFYSQYDGYFSLSSEIKALKLVNKRSYLDKKVIENYILYSITDTKKTFFNDIKELPPGKVFKWSKENGLEEKLNFCLNFMHIEYDNKKNFLEFVESTKEKLLKSTQIHLMADVEVGISLSSGVDSSLLASLVNHISNKNKLKAFTVEFEEFNNETNDALKYASKNGFEHIVTRMRKDQLFPLLIEQIQIQDCPAGGLMNLGQYLNFKTVSNHNVKVLLDGAGLDEAYGGYRSSHLQFLSELKNYDYKKFIHEKNNFKNFWEIESNFFEKLLKNYENSNSTEIDGTVDIIKMKLDQNRNSDLSSLQLKKNLIYSSKLRRGLRMKDRASMKNSIELRVPFVDKEIIFEGLKIPPEFGFYRGFSKSVIREVGFSLSQNDIFYKKKKSINAPQSRWLKDNYQEVRKICLEVPKKIDSIDLKQIKKDLDLLKSGQIKNSFGIWRVLNASLMLDIYK